MLCIYNNDFNELSNAYHFSLVINSVIITNYMCNSPLNSFFSNVFNLNIFFINSIDIINKEHFMHLLRK